MTKFEINDDSGEERIEWCEENNGSKAFYSVPLEMVETRNINLILYEAKNKVKDDLL